MEIIKLSEETKNYIEGVKEQMKNLGVFEETDGENLDLLASQIELYIRSMRELDEKGMVVTDQKGRMIANPCFSISRSCMTQITSLIKELSISTRQRRLLSKDSMTAESSPLDDFVDKIQGLI